MLVSVSARLGRCAVVCGLCSCCCCRVVTGCRVWETARTAAGVCVQLGLSSSMHGVQLLLQGAAEHAGLPLFWCTAGPGQCSLHAVQQQLLQGAAGHPGLPPHWCQCWVLPRPSCASTSSLQGSWPLHASSSSSTACTPPARGSSSLTSLPPCPCALQPRRATPRCPRWRA